ncbi:MAG: SH3 domain-containing protein [Treponema sp.]|nr:SH3 domain-containing protein [Treponema sp.]
MKYVVTEEHRTQFPNPIQLKLGEKVRLGKTAEETVGETPGDENWTLCAKLDGSNEGWVPNQIITRDGDYGYIIEDYSARELDVDKGTLVKAIREMNGWMWLEHRNEVGWVPLYKLQKVD